MNRWIPTLMIVAAIAAIIGCTGGSEKEKYLTDVTSRAEPLLESQDELTYLLIYDPRDVNDTGWKEEVRHQLGIWDQIYEDAQGFEPPDELVLMHEKYLEGLKIYSSAASDISLWLDNPESDLINQGIDQIAEGLQALWEAGAILADIEGLPAPPKPQSR